MVLLKNPSGDVVNFVSWGNNSHGGYVWNKNQGSNTSAALHRTKVNCDPDCSKPAHWEIAPRAPYGWDFHFDANGNLIIDKDLGNALGIQKGIAFWYDERNLPIRIANAKYRYNSAGQRYAKIHNGQLTDFYVMDGDRIIAVLTGAAQAKHFNLFGIGTIGRYEPAGGGQKYFYITDHLGSTRAVVNQSGEIIEAHDYYPFGLLMWDRSYVSGSGTKEGFTGKERDGETGFDYFGARYYNPALGRWMNPDPLADKYPGWSPYNYVLNNPLRFVDPDGKEVAVYARTPAFRLALAIFASTDIGYAFLSRFATAGQAVAGRYFPSDGVWSQYRLEIREGTEPMAPRGRTRYGYFQQSRGTMQFVQGSVVGPQTVRPGARPGVRMEIMPRILEEMVLTLGHEAFLHILESFALLVSLIEDAEHWEDIQKAFALQREQSGPQGQRHHEAYVRKEGGYGNFESYYQQLNNHWLKLEMPLLKEAREEHDRRLRE